MKISLVKRLFWGFLGVIFVTCSLSSGVGLSLLGRSIVSRIEDKVRLDLRSARDLFEEELTSIRDPIRISALNFSNYGIESSAEIKRLELLLNRIADQEAYDILTFVSPTADVILQIKNPGRKAPTRLGTKLVNRVLAEKKGMVFTEVLDRGELMKEGFDLEERARIDIVPSPYLKPEDKAKATSGMIIVAAAPVLTDHNVPIGVLYGGRLISKREEIAERIVSKIYKNETFQGRDVGLATIFMSGIRISTTVLRKNGTRALGTVVSDDVYDHVLKKGKTWVSRPFAVNSRYITAYEPIVNMSNEIVGMLSIGVLEDRYRDIHKNALQSFLIITAGAIIVSLGVCYLFIETTMKPIGALVTATKKLADGNLTQQVHLKKAPPEIAVLGNAFNSMANSISERDQELRNRATEEIMKSERLAMIGQLAAGVAHEINNPLGSILLLNRLVLKKCEPATVMLENTQRIEREVKRCQKVVQGLLEFARQREPKAKTVDLNTLLDKTIALVENQSMFHNISIVKEYKTDLPPVTVDPSQLQQVFMNILINAVDAMEGRGTLTLMTKADDVTGTVDACFQDTGCGMEKETLDRIFEPFYTTKDVGHGTGLGLSISLGLVQRNGGMIRISSQPEEGSHFVVALPRSKENSIE
jgi:two-component system, NtrC family, sensor kinase